MESTKVPHSKTKNRIPTLSTSRLRNRTLIFGPSESEHKVILESGV